MKKVKLFLALVLILGILLSLPFKVSADSGFDAKYDSSSTADIFGSLTSAASPALKLIAAQPGEENYQSAYIIISAICIILVYMFSCRYILKLNNRKKKKWLIALLFGLIPTILFFLFCYFIKTQLLLYILAALFYIIIFKIVTLIITRIKLKRTIKKVEEMDKCFNVETVNNEVFELYKEVQITWMNFDLKNLKELVSKEMFDKYKEQLEKLKQVNQKNMMEKIEFKSNKIVGVYIDNNNETIECEMKIDCFDYIIDNEEKVIKGKKDKYNSYTYKLVVTKEVNKNKYTLIEKKILKQK